MRDLESGLAAVAQVPDQRSVFASFENRRHGHPVLRKRTLGVLYHLDFPASYVRFDPQAGATAHAQFYVKLTLAPDPVVPRHLSLLYLHALLSSSDLSAVVNPSSSSCSTMAIYGDNAPQLAGSVIALTVIAYITYGLRIYTRLRNGSWGMDDWSMSVAMVCSLRHSRLAQYTDQPAPIHSAYSSMHWRCIQWHRYSQREA